jgi:hypothetical protein
MLEKFSQVAHILFAQRGSMVRPMQAALNPVEKNMQFRTMGLDLGPQGIQQGFHVTPVDVCTDRFFHNGFKRVALFVVHLF